MAQANAFIDYLAEVKPLIEEQLVPDRVRLGVPSIERDLDAYLYGPYDRFVSSGGKRTRPALCLLGCEAVGGARGTALPLAAAIEHFQAAALIHDDIADEGMTRRGNPCISGDELCPLGRREEHGRSGHRSTGNRALRPRASRQKGDGSAQDGS